MSDIPFVAVADYVFNAASIISIDLTKYTPSPVLEDGIESETQRRLWSHRQITLTLLGPVKHVFEKTRADAMYAWYIDISGQRRIDNSQRGIVQFPPR